MMNFRNKLILGSFVGAVLLVTMLGAASLFSNTNDTLTQSDLEIFRAFDEISSTQFVEFFSETAHQFELCISEDQRSCDTGSSKAHA